MGSSTAQTNPIDGVEMALFASRVQSICDEMGAVLKRAAFSPNIKDRLDFSCALFDADGALFAQAAHIPVHLGSMAFAMAEIVARFDWRMGDLVLLNDPFLGGTHLPDVTAIAPVFSAGDHLGFAATRAHHAHIGAERPGSMPVSTRLEEEGLIIAPMVARRAGALTEAGRALFDALGSATAETEEDYSADPALADFFAQMSACTLGARRVAELATALPNAGFGARIASLNEYAERIARDALSALPAGRYAATDLMDDDGAGTVDVPIRLQLDIAEGTVVADFTASADQVAGNINCPRAVTAAAVFYVFRCLMPANAPAVAGALRPIRLRTRRGSIVDAERPAAVAAGNVETSMRIVDVLLRALADAMPERIPAASQGTMNNLAMGLHTAARRWAYYETMAGGAGAHATGAGASGVHSHMTNTLNTPVESLESHYPVRVLRYALRPGSGGAGAHRGGDGLVREFEFLEATEITLLTERRRRGPYGLAGGASGTPGRNLLNGAPLPAKAERSVAAGDRLRIETPGGGGFGAP
jgi:N-methylhydantoinase B